MKIPVAGALFAGLLAFSVSMEAQSSSTSITFDNFANGTAVNDQIGGVTFSPALIASSNNSFYPPHSGNTVALGIVNGDNVLFTITFSSPAATVGGYFTYTGGVTMTAYDSGGNPVGSASAAGANIVGSGSTPPNTHLQVSSGKGIAKITLISQVHGAGFALDDLTISPGLIAGPTCTLDHISPGPPVVLVIQVAAISYGLQNVNVLEDVNASIAIQPFAPGSQYGSVSATKIDPGKGSSVGFLITDRDGLATSCDPVDFTMELDNARQQHVFRGLPSSEHFVRIVNGSPGVRDLVFLVNGHRFPVPDLRDGENYSVDIGPAMFAEGPVTGAERRGLRRGTGMGNNYVVVQATGSLGSSAYILIGDASVQ